MKKVMFIVAHPDDESLGCGGLISKFVRNNIQVFVLVVAEGSSCRFSKLDFDANWDCISRTIRQRSRMFKDAMSYLGVNTTYENNFRCGALSMTPLIEINQLIEEKIRDWKPDTVITHSYIDSNLDHQTIFNSVRIATRPTPNSRIKTVLSFEIPSSTDWAFTQSFVPNYFVELSAKDLENKIKALSFYDTEIPSNNHPRSLANIRALAKIRGSQVGVEYAEAYCLIRHSD